MQTNKVIKILVVEDDPSYFTLLERMISRTSGLFEIVLAKNLEQALIKVKEGFDLVFLDLFLPDSQGIETIEPMVKACQPAIPIVVMSSLNDDTMIQKAITYGVHDYLIKWDADSSTIAHVVKHAIRQNLIRFRLDTAKHIAKLEEMDERLAFTLSGS